MTKTGTTRAWPILVATILVLGAFLPVAAGPAAAEDWGDARRDRMEAEIRRLQVEEAARQGSRVAQVELGSLVGLRHGKVQLVANLARVDLTLEVQNTSSEAMEWRRSFVVDQHAEAIGATLQRGTGPVEVAQTLNLDEARRIYGEIRNPRPTRRVSRNWGWTNDPLRIERPDRRRLDVAVWPIAPGETVRVGMVFVSPLRGRGMSRTYVDPIQGDLGTSPAPTVTVPDLSNARVLATMDAAWMVHPGDLTVGEPVGMVPAGEVAGWHRFVNATGREETRAPELPLHLKRPTRTVHTVAGGGLGTRVAVWHFDPIEFLEDHDLHPPANGTLRLLKRQGSTSRIAPWEFEVTGEPLPVTARLLPSSEDLRYAVEVLDGQGQVLQTVEVRRDVDRTPLDTDRAGAISGWHRAALAARVAHWALGDAERERRAVDFAADLGVLTAGTAALAVPPAERTRLGRRSRSEYHQGGAPLGAQNREADHRTPPPRSTSR